ncbi:T9SS type A sorting domain-containing protein [Cytophagales bacterium LB-30]|uniref:T9SS type A sorting domain-containing protein n=1 Tax=Shiella aurantiaca TaxID=3058365 RepID=A0ABT8FA98_9BACT|nr:T9SS type A sorting domain-containing protein [Shiella aurantiaca]MDN4166896.1 T9SS type A sorting domain-containing protein [Shiella aurantiaca]
MSQNFTSAGNGDWTSTANWTRNSGCCANTPPILGGYGTWNLNHDQTIDDDFQNGSSTLNIALNKTLTINGDFTSGGGATINVSGTLVVEGDIILNSRINVLPGGKLIAKGDVRVNSSNYLIIGTNVAPPPYADLVVNGDLNAFTSGDVILNRNARAAVFGDVSDNGGGGTILRVNNGAQLYVHGDVNYSGGGSTIQNNNTVSPFGLYVNGDITNTGGGSSTTTNLGDQQTLIDTNPDFLDWISIQENSPLPIELLFFKGSVSASAVNLSWATAMEENFDYFSVQRSKNGKDFEEIAQIQGAGFSRAILNYSYSDESAPAGRIYYRLNAIDFDGSYQYSNIIAFNTTGKSAAITLYPNPSKGESIVIRSEELQEQGTVYVYDLSGNLVNESEYQPGIATQFDSKLKPGVYMVTVSTPSAQSKAKLIVQ